MKKITLTFLFFAQLSALFAQDSASGIEMADAFRADGKIYVVVATVLIIFSILIAYLVRLDKKLNNLQK